MYQNYYAVQHHCLSIKKIFRLFYKHVNKLKCRRRWSNAIFSIKIGLPAYATILFKKDWILFLAFSMQANSSPSKTFFSFHCSSTMCVYVAKVCGQYVSEKRSLLPILKNMCQATCG